MKIRVSVRGVWSQQAGTAVVEFNGLSVVDGFGDVPLEYPISQPQRLLSTSPTIDSPLSAKESTSLQPDPLGTGPYWIRENRLAIKAPIERTAAVDIESMVWAALAHSPYVQSIQIRPMILESEIDQARGSFDPAQFANSIWNDRSDPVGNTQIQAAKVKLKVGEQDLRPTLNLVTDFYVRGLNGEYDVSNSFGDHFSAGAPSYSGGLECLRPKNQTLANAIRRQRNLEIRQLLFDLEDRLLIVGKEVRTAIAAVQASHAEMEASARATIANNSEVEYLESKWQKHFPSELYRIDLRALVQ